MYLEKMGLLTCNHGSSSGHSVNGSKAKGKRMELVNRKAKGEDEEVPLSGAEGKSKYASWRSMVVN